MQTLDRPASSVLIDDLSDLAQYPDGTKLWVAWMGGSGSPYVLSRKDDQCFAVPDTPGWSGDKHHPDRLIGDLNPPNGLTVWVIG